MVVRLIGPSVHSQRTQSEPIFNYILARIETSTNPPQVKGYSVRKYLKGKGKITDTPLREMRASSIRELEDKIVPNNCMNWGLDEVLGYSGPVVSEGQKLSLCPVTEEELKGYKGLLKEVKLRLR